ncbi:peptidase [Actinomyces sp. 2119]|uniref:DUF5979 domain-containing protein n=1 Tax=Actinomyces sp. 2119 TaxID=2321393 RepID=UPI000E6C6D3A|nr:DUF5979 domain-containing protein [Actinomyces sp. 2119]RJF40989.1 peptidase [Actinomyces sp. 2119]
MLVFSGRGASAPGLRLRVACLALLALFLGLLSPLPAHADVNQGIEVKDLTLTKSDRNGNDSAGALTTQDVAKLTYSWDATGTTVNPGDSFSVNLGNYFRNLESPKTVPMTLPYNGTQTEIGSCSLTEKEIECTFSDSVTDLKNAGFTNFRGSGEALLLVTRTTTAEEVDMTVNGSQTVSVDLPGTGGISGVPEVVYTPFKFTKMSSVIASSSSSMIWEVNFGSDYIKEQLAGGDSPIEADGTTRQTITVTDTLGAGMAFNPDMSKWFFMVRNSAAEPSLPGVNVTNAAGTDLSTTYGDFDMAVSIEGQVATITVTGPFAAQTNYKISYPVTFTSQSGTAIAGVQYGNSASLNDSGAQGEFTRSYTDSFKVIVEMEAGFGGFEILKTLSGSGVDAVDVASTTLPVTVEYTLPGPASSYEGWQAPGTLSDDGVSGTTTMPVSIGRTNTYPATFPQGTVITLSEDTSKASPAPEGFTWGEPVFTVGQTETNRLTIADQTSTRVTLNNVAEVVTASGTFQVVKEVSGLEEAEGGAQREFTFSYTCSDGQTGSVTATGDGQPAQVDQTFEAGTTCEVSEDVDDAQVDGYVLVASEPQTVTISESTEEEPAVTASFTNTYTRETGSFSVAKIVEGGPEGTDQTSFAISYTCEDGTQGTLSVPGDGTEVESPQLPAGATCTLEEDADSAAREGYSVVTSFSPETVTITKDKVVAVTVTNTYTRETGSFSVVKDVKGDYSPTSSDSVKVSYTCDDADSASGTLDVAMDGTPTSGPSLPTGTTCTLKEDANSAAREGYAVATAYSDTTVSVVQGSTPSVTVTNTYTRLKGGFTISKTVEGDGASLAPEEFTFTYTCTDEVTGEAGESVEVTVKAGETVEVSEVVSGSCTVSEKEAPVEGASLTTRLAVNGQDVDGGEATFDVTGGEDTAVAVSATNTYTLERGTFNLSKTVEGDGSEDISKKSFVFDYTCSSQAEGEVTGELTVAGDGSATESGLQLPVGAECTVTERASSAQVEGYDVAVPQAQQLTIEAADDGQDPTTLSFTNTYTEIPPSEDPTPSPSPTPSEDPTPSPGPSGSESPQPGGTTPTTDPSPGPSGSESPQPGGSGVPEPTSSGAAVDQGPSLARTGASVLVPLVIALAAIIGGVVLVRRRKA